MTAVDVKAAVQRQYAGRLIQFRHAHQAGIGQRGGNNSAQGFAEGLGTALRIGLVIFGAAAAGNAGTYSNSGSSPDLSAILDRPRAAEVRLYSSSGNSVSTGTVPSTRKVEQDVEAMNIYTRALRGQFISPAGTRLS